MSKLATIKLSGKDYATVPTRIKEFREKCPNGLIETKPTFLENNMVSFETRILKDKSNPSSGEGTGHSLGSLVVAKTGVADPKAFEKLETISIGRALAIIGFMASGEVASFEEMEDFLSEKESKRQTKIDEIIELVDAAKTIAELRIIYKENRGYGADLDNYIMTKVDELKK